MQLFNRTRLIAGLAGQVDKVAAAGLCHTATSCWLLRVGFISSKNGRSIPNPTQMRNQDHTCVYNSDGDALVTGAHQ